MAESTTSATDGVNGQTTASTSVAGIGSAPSFTDGMSVAPASFRPWTPITVTPPPYPEHFPHVQRTTIYYSGTANWLGGVHNVWVYEDAHDVPNCWYCQSSPDAAQDDWTWIRACREDQYLEEYVSCRATRWNGYLWITMCSSCLLDMFAGGINVTLPLGVRRWHVRPPPPPRDEPPHTQPMSHREPRPAADDVLAEGEIEMSF